MLYHDDVRFGKLFIVIILFLRGFGVFLLPQVKVDLGDGDGPRAVIWVLGRARRGGDDNRDGGHVTDCLRDVITEGELEIICDVSEGFIKKGSVVGASVVEDVL